MRTRRSLRGGAFAATRDAMPSADTQAPAAVALAPTGAAQHAPAVPTETPLPLSVVVPVRNEAPNIAPLVAEIEAALAGIRHEIVYVDDGSSDDTVAALRLAAASGAPVRVLRHRASCGQSAAVVTGVRAARGTWIATLDGDGQNDPADIPRMLARAGAEAKAGNAAILVAGHRVTRRDSWVKRRSQPHRQCRPRPAAAGCDAGYRLRAEGLPARALPRPAGLRPHAPLPAGAGAAPGRAGGERCR